MSNPLVFDIGSAYSKIGNAGDDAPLYRFPTVVGRPRNPSDKEGMTANDYYVGKDVLTKRAELEKPIEIKWKYTMNDPENIDWGDMEKVYEYSFKKLGKNSEEQNVLVTSIPFYPHLSRERTTQIMMETFKTKGVYVSRPGVLSLYSNNTIF